MMVTSGAPGSPRRRTSGSKTIRQSEARLIGIGAAVTRRPLPHHRAYGSVHGGSRRLRRHFLDSSGSKGTYARTLWPYFSKKYDFAENIIAMLHKSSDTQNYVAAYFLSIPEELAERTNTTDQMIRALKRAVDNGATTVIEGLPNLPKEWVARIAPGKK